MIARPGEALNDLVATLERILANSENASIEVRKKLPDRDTGRLREHDVVIIWRQQHHTIVTAIECRDRSRRVGVPDVEAFADKCEHTGVHHGVMVSASGFTETARVKALKRGITFLDLREAQAFDWMGMEFFVGYERKFSPVDAHVFFKDAKPEGEFVLFDTAGNEVSAEGLATLFMRKVPESDQPGGGAGTLTNVRMRMNTVDWIARDPEGREFLVDHILAKASYTVVKHVHQVTLHSYSGGGKDYEIVTAEADIGQAKGKMIMVKDDEGIRVFWDAKAKD
jgi:hypothetical protein